MIRTIADTNAAMDIVMALFCLTSRAGLYIALTAKNTSESLMPEAKTFGLLWGDEGKGESAAQHDNNHSSIHPHFHTGCRPHKPTCSPRTTARGLNSAFLSASFCSTRPPVFPPAPGHARHVLQNKEPNIRPIRTLYKPQIALHVRVVAALW